MTQLADGRSADDGGAEVNRARLRSAGRDHALTSALRKRAAGVPSYTIAEAAELCSVSQEHLHRLVKGGAFPAIRMRRGQEQGRYVIPAKAVEELLSAASAAGGCLEIADWARTWNAAAGQAGSAA